MNTVGIAELKVRLSKYIEKVKRGREVLVTEHGLPVAKLVPVAENFPARKKRLVRAGVLVSGRGRLPASMRRPPKGDPRIGAEVLAALLAERELGR